MQSIEQLGLSRQAVLHDLPHLFLHGLIDVQRVAHLDNLLGSQVKDSLEEELVWMSLRAWLGWLFHLLILFLEDLWLLTGSWRGGVTFLHVFIV